MVGQLNMTVVAFANHFIPSNAKIRVIKSSEIIFEGTTEYLYYNSDVLNLTVAMVGAKEDYICLSCR